MSSNQRENFRIEYPAPERPLLRIAGVEHQVLDLSEKGVKFQITEAFKPAVKVQVMGEIKFKDGKTCRVTGTVLRVDEKNGFAVLALTLGIPLPKMMEEQRYLIQKYKT